jgi:hypothetical protein
LNQTTSARTPELPCARLGHVVPLEVEHAILGSTVCFKMAEDLDRAATQLVPEEGFVRMAAHYAVLVSSHDGRSGGALLKTPLSAINAFLDSRLRVRIKSGQEVSRVLDDLQLRRDVERAWATDGRRPPKRRARPRRT